MSNTPALQDLYYELRLFYLFANLRVAAELIINRNGIGLIAANVNFISNELQIHHRFASTDTHESVDQDYRPEYEE